MKQISIHSVFNSCRKELETALEKLLGQARLGLITQVLRTEYYPDKIAEYHHHPMNFATYFLLLEDLYNSRTLPAFRQHPGLLKVLLHLSAEQSDAIFCRLV